MARQVGLRTEIIVNLCILVGAALLFSGFLLLNLLERELVRNHSENARQQLILAARLAETLADEKVVAIRRAFAGTSASWFLADSNLQIIAADSATSFSCPRREDLNSVRFEEEPLTTLDYASFYLPKRKDAETITITVPLRTGGRFTGALQACFPLTPVKAALAEATRFYLFFILLYGGVLLLFGFWLLGKAVVRPVRQLTAATARVAEGHLEPVGVPDEPREIADLARSFNHMTGALQESQTKTNNSITSLRQANEELRRTRDELVRSERLASVGHLAAGMAHEIGNPLGAIIGYLELLSNELSPGREREIAIRAGAEAERINRLIRELLDYARPDSLDTEPCDPAAVLSEAVELLTNQGVLTGIAVENRLPAILPRVLIARHKLLQVFVNLLVNARDSIRLQVDEKVYSGIIRLAGGAKDNEIWLAVGDNGGGIDPEIIPHIFDPFFTTKAPGHGRGLGLAVCHRIVTESGGRIEVQSSREGGSTFTVRMQCPKVETA